MQTLIAALIRSGRYKIEAIRSVLPTIKLEKPSNSPMYQVLLTLYAVGSVALKNGYQGPCIGAKLSAANPREFTEEQLKQGETMIGLQMGSHKGASQAGMNIGKTRNIMD